MTSVRRLPRHEIAPIAYDGKLNRGTTLQAIPGADPSLGELRQAVLLS